MMGAPALQMTCCKIDSSWGPMDLRPEVLEMIAASVAIVVAGGLSAVLAARRAQRTIGRTLAAASTMVSKGLAAEDSGHALDQITKDLAGLLGVEACVVALPTGDGRLAVGASHGYPNPELRFIGETEGMSARSCRRYRVSSWRAWRRATTSMPRSTR